MAQLLMRNARRAIWASLVLVLLAVVLALWPTSSGDPANLSHRSHQLRFAAIAVLYLGLVSLSLNRMGAFDADVLAMFVLVWSAWVLGRGWWALSRGVGVAAPAGWWLALTVDVISIGLFAAVMIALDRGGMRLF